MLNKIKRLIFFMFLAGVAIFVACTQGTNTRNVSPTSSNIAAGSPASTVDQLAVGRNLYQQNCAKCHRDVGTGGKITIDGKQFDPKDLTSEKMKGRSDDKLLRDIGDGAPDDGMPAFKDKLTETQIKETVRFIRGELQKASLTTTK